MDFLLIRKYKYQINDSIENVRTDISKITDRKWHDFSSNISGTLRGDNTFRFTHKWSFIVIQGGGSAVYLNGELKEKNENVIMDIKIRPNIVLLFFFYLMAILSLCEFLGIKTMIEAHRFVVAPLLLFFCLIIFGIIYYMGNGLKNRFERLLHLTR